MTRLNFGNYILDSSKKTLLMGVINVTPDSFSDGGKFDSVETAVNHAKKLVSEGADIIDIGGESTRPGAKAVTAKDELLRVLPVLKQIADDVNVPISIDTYKATVAEKAIDAGASLVNDITALQGDPHMVNVIANANVHVCLMHMKGNPRTMQKKPTYTHLIEEIRFFLKERADYALFHDIPKKHILFDPGIGFGKRTGRGVEDNCDILHQLNVLKKEGYPVLVGASRKTFIGNISGDKPVLPVDERLEGSIAAACIAAYNGADILRVHDVAETRKAIDIVDCILGKSIVKNDEHPQKF